MSDKPVLDWEYIGCVAFYGQGDIIRARIPGGWLVCPYDDNTSRSGNGSGNQRNNAIRGICFVPDPEHKWDGNTEYT